jgi:peptide/nickel transport system ATP-binding protein
MSLLELQGLQTWFKGSRGPIRAVDGVDLSLDSGRTLALVGESGCGKTVTALSIPDLVPCPPGIRAGGRILFQGRNLRTLSPPQMRGLRGREIAMVFQEPMTSLNPVLRVGDQVAEVLRVHTRSSRKEARERSIEMLGRVGIPDAPRRYGDYPHQLSGGLRQRVMIAMALMCKPSLLIADEPTTALDVTVQAQVLDLLADLQAELGTAILFITHDLSVVATIANEVAVMYAGRVIERSSTLQLFDDPRHPYTRALLRCLPGAQRQRLEAIPGQVPAPDDRPPGCAFHDRCAHADKRCAAETPALLPTVQVACHGVQEDRIPRGRP